MLQERKLQAIKLQHILGNHQKNYKVDLITHEAQVLLGNYNLVMTFHRDGCLDYIKHNTR